MITRWYHSSNSSNVLTPKQLNYEYNKYIRTHQNSYVLAIRITNFRDIVATCFYGKTRETIDEFIKTIREYYKDSLIGSVVDGDFVVITDQSINEVGQFFKKLITELHQKYMDNIFPMEIKFLCGISLNSNLGINEDIRRATVAMLYPRSPSIYVQYYTEELDEELKKQNEAIQKIDRLMKEKEISYHKLAIQTVNDEIKMFEIRMLEDYEHDLYQSKNLPLFKKYCRFTKLDTYMMNTLLETIEMDPNTCYVLNFSFLSIYLNYYTFLKKLKELIEDKGLSTEQVCININYTNYQDSLTELLYVTREIQSYGFKIGLQYFGILEQSYSLTVAAAIEVDYIKVGKDVLIKAMNEERLCTMLQYFVKMYLELGITPIFTDVESEYQKKFIEDISTECLIRWKNR